MNHQLPDDFQPKNERRIDLIEKDIRSTLTNDEASELNELTAYVRRVLDTAFPLLMPIIYFDHQIREIGDRLNGNASARHDA